MSDELLAVASVIRKAVDDNRVLIGDEESPEPGDSSLQCQHKTIEGLLANLTGGSFHTVDDVVPEEHTFTRVWEAVRNTIDITMNGSNHIVMLIGNPSTSSNTLAVATMDPETGIMVEGSTLELPESVDLKYGSCLLEQCGTKYALLYHKMTYNTSGSVPVYSEGASKIYIFNQTFDYESVIDIPTLFSGYGIRGMGWDGTNLHLLLHKPNVFVDAQYGFTDSFAKIDLEGNIITDSLVELTKGQTAITAPVLNKYTHKQKLAINAAGNEIYFPKILFSQVSSRIWAVNGAGDLVRILRFTDMLGGVIAEGNDYNNLNTVLTSCLYQAPYLWLLLNPSSLQFPIVARVRINYNEGS